MRKIHKLTEQERSFAEVHHDMIYRFLTHFHLSEDDYYDVVVFGYLLAVQEYVSLEPLQDYSFSTIAWTRMLHSLSEYNRYVNRSKRKAITVAFQDENHIAELNQMLPGRTSTIEDQLLDHEILCELLSYATAQDRSILLMMADGYSYKEIAAQLQTSMAHIRKTIARYRLRLMAPRQTGHDMHIA
ncbi:RNA polymerase sigma factor [Merdimonas faecis]|uniref:RNA polymerase sigma factor n=1 Tax=Merdimonas faecis TaxID=1653435 RepID=UPI0008636A48|nr:sigma factor-like helix-turn-helix DNA-binding protein [Merdimonas faecis]